MPRSPVFTAFVLYLSFAWLAAGMPTSAQGPQVPPGTPQIIVPPVVNSPTVAPKLDVEPDDLKKPFAIRATVSGGVVADSVVTIPVGKLLKLTLEGDVVEQADETPVVAWAMSAETDDVDNHPPGGPHLTLTSPVNATFLVTAAINNPDSAGPPLLAQRWVVFGVAPQPPPVVVDPVVPPVDPKPVPSTVTSITYVFEKSDGGVPPAVQAGLAQVNRESEGKIKATMYERYDGDDHKIPEQYKIPFAKATEVGLPALVVMSDSNLVRIVKAPKTVEQIVEAAK